MAKKHPNLNKDIGLRIKHIRRHIDMTQEAFAEKIGVSVTFISGLESGKYGCSLSTLCDICECLHVTSDYLLFGGNPNKPNGSFKLTAEQEVIMNQGIAIIYDALMMNPENKKKDNA